MGLACVRCIEAERIGSVGINSGGIRCAGSASILSGGGASRVGGKLSGPVVCEEAGRRDLPAGLSSKNGSFRAEFKNSS